MDIFTTALTRVVPVPIKRANLKVKALAKEAATSGVSDDVDGLENHQLYLKKSTDDPDAGDEDDNTEQPTSQAIEASPVPSDNTGQTIDVFDDSDRESEGESKGSEKNKKDSPPHFDLYV